MSSCDFVFRSTRLNNFASSVVIKVTVSDNNVTIRHASIVDAKAIAGCLAAAFEPYKTSYTRPAFNDTVLDVIGVEHRLRDMTVLLADNADGNLLGTIAYELNSKGVGHLRGMAVMPHCLGSGVAGRLLAAAEQELAQLGCVRVTLDTTAPLERAIRFYKRNGYHATGVVADFYGMELFEYAKDFRS